MNKPSDILEIRESTFYNPNVKDDIKIASIGDTHISRLVGKKDINNIYDALCSVNPDYICLLGDIVDSPRELTKEESIKNLELLISLCSSIAPTMVILGSHDFVYEHPGVSFYSYDDTGLWSEIGKIPNVYLLNDKVFNDNRIIISGYLQKVDAYLNLADEHVEDPAAYYHDFISHPDLYEGLDENLPKILLTHSPEPINDLNVQELLKDYDVILTGHYHNGCVPSFLDRIYPKNAGIITPRMKKLPRHARGIIKLNTGTYLVYSGGWVKLSESAPGLIRPLDKLCNRQMDVTTLTSNEEFIKEEIKTKKLVLK